MTGGGWHHMMTGGSWPTIVLWALVVVALIAVAVWITTRSPHAGSPPRATTTAQELLADRLARGDIDVDDYQTRTAALHEHTPVSPP
jgi:putative membrane protein